MEYLSSNSRFEVQNNRTYLPLITMETYTLNYIINHINENFYECYVPCFFDSEGKQRFGVVIRVLLDVMDNDGEEMSFVNCDPRCVVL